MDRVVFSRETDLWRTERALVAWLQRQAGPFTLDAAARDGLIAPCWYGPGSPHAEDGLQAPWDGDVFCNPPYGETALFVGKALWEVAENPACASVTLLVGARTDTAWWQDSFPRWTQVAFLRTRTRFWLSPAEAAAIQTARQAAGKAPLSVDLPAPFPSALLRWSRSLAGTVAPAALPLVACVDWRADVAASAAA